MRHAAFRIAVVAFAFATGLAAQLSEPSGASRLPQTLRDVSFEQRLDAPVPLSTMFRDETGATVKLDKFFHGKPVILATVYYRCPMLCSQILSGVVRGLRPLSLTPGRDFEVVAISINPDETPQDAAAKRDRYSRSYSGRAGSPGWHFLVGENASIKAVTDAIGFHYHYDAATKMYFHASGITVLTPEGRVSRYLYGVDYEPKDLKLGLIEASHEKIGSPVDQVLLFCYHYDPKTGKYSAAVINLLRFTSALLLLLLVAGLGWLWRRDLRTYANEPLRRAGRR